MIYSSSIKAESLKILRKASFTGTSTNGKEITNPFGGPGEGHWIQWGRSVYRCFYPMRGLQWGEASEAQFCEVSMKALQSHMEAVVWLSVFCEVRLQVLPSHMGAMVRLSVSRDGRATGYYSTCGSSMWPLHGVVNYSSMWKLWWTLVCSVRSLWRSFHPTWRLWWACVSSEASVTVASVPHMVRLSVSRDGTATCVSVLHGGHGEAQCVQWGHQGGASVEPSELQAFALSNAQEHLGPGQRTVAKGSLGRLCPHSTLTLYWSLAWYSEDSLCPTLWKFIPLTQSGCLNKFQRD